MADLQYLEIVINPCQIFYRHKEDQVYVMRIMRSKRDLSKH
nr:hypothetical protein [Abyssogena phaseoliformis symbiont]